MISVSDSLSLLPSGYRKLLADVATCKSDPKLIVHQGTQVITESLPQPLQTKLIPSTNGIGHCIDDRQQRHTRVGGAPSGIAGGAVGVQSMFMLLGQDLGKARFSTRALYKKMDWGKITFHTDEQERKKLGGCGYAQHLSTISGIVANHFPDSFLKPHPELLGADVGVKAIANLKRIRRSKEVVLKGVHHPEATLVINFNTGTTLDRATLPKNSATFLWDAHVLCQEKVVENVNSLTGRGLSLVEWERLLIVTTLATFGHLKAVSNNRIELPIILSNKK